MKQLVTVSPASDCLNYCSNRTVLSVVVASTSLRLVVQPTDCGFFFFVVFVLIYAGVNVILIGGGLMLAERDVMMGILGTGEVTSRGEDVWGVYNWWLLRLLGAAPAVCSYMDHLY